MRITARERKSYLKKIKKLLVCNYAKKKEIICALDIDINEYIKEYPDIDIKNLQQEIGTPEEIADSFLESMPAENIRKQVNLAKRLTIGIVFALVMLLISLCFALNDAHNSHYGSVNHNIKKIVSIKI